jgi:biopolymer transport protein TolR
MAGGMDLGTSGKGGKKPLDATINLVPFIDLMAVTISFLIMTAVWTQIGRIQVAQSGGPSDPTQEAKPDTSVPVTLLLTATEAKLSVGPVAPEVFPLNRTTQNGKEKLDLTRLVAKLKDVKTQLPDQSNITIQAEDLVRYEDLVRVIDECIGVGLPSVSVQAALG